MWAIAENVALHILGLFVAYFWFYVLASSMGKYRVATIEICRIFYNEFMLVLWNADADGGAAEAAQPNVAM